LVVWAVVVLVVFVLLEYRQQVELPIQAVEAVAVLLLALSLMAEMALALMAALVS
jgi:hypothetical protein